MQKNGRGKYVKKELHRLQAEEDGEREGKRKRKRRQEMQYVDKLLTWPSPRPD